MGAEGSILARANRIVTTPVTTVVSQNSPSIPTTGRWVRRSGVSPRSRRWRKTVSHRRRGSRMSACAPRRARSGMRSSSRRVVNTTPIGLNCVRGKARRHAPAHSKPVVSTRPCRTSRLVQNCVPVKDSGSVLGSTTPRRHGPHAGGCPRSGRLIEKIKEFDEEAFEGEWGQIRTEAGDTSGIRMFAGGARQRQRAKLRRLRSAARGVDQKIHE